MRVLRAVSVLLVVGSMAGSIVWTLGHQETLAALGGWLAGQAGQLAWLGVRGVASNFIEQPWFEGLKALAAHPGVRHIKVADASGRRLGRSYGVKLWPTLVFLRDGKEAARLVRPDESTEIAEALSQIDTVRAT